MPITQDRLNKMTNHAAREIEQNDQMREFIEQTLTNYYSGQIDLENLLAALRSLGELFRPHIDARVDTKLELQHYARTHKANVHNAMKQSTRRAQASAGTSHQPARSHGREPYAVIPSQPVPGGLVPGADGGDTADLVL